MAYPGINWQVMNLPFAAGLNQKADDRARPQPFLDIARDVQFDELGGVQTRLPFGAGAGAIFGGGTIANARRIEPYGDEIVLFTDTQVYSWNAQLSKWVLRGTHLAVAVDEAPRFTTTDDQVDCDRAELAGTIVFAWSVANATTFVAALDKATGSVLMSPTAIAGVFIRPRLVSLATKILLFVHDASSNLKVFAIDPASPATAIAGAATTVLATVANFLYDVVKVDGQDLAVGAIRRTTTTSYTVFTVTAGLAVTAVTKARTADGPLAVATTPSGGTQIQVVRGSGTNIQGDLITTSTLADVFTGQAIGTVAATPVNQIAVAFASSTATAMWSSEETSGASAGLFATKKNTVTTGNVIGTQSILVRRLGVASRAFEHGGRVFAWLAFAEDSTSFGSGSPLGIRAQLQNTYFLYRDDGLVVSKATWQTGGGYSPSVGHLPGVALVDGSNGYAWCATSRRKIDLAGNDHTGFGARSPRDVMFAFDSNEARRCARLGNTLYITGGIVLQYDGFALTEVGFLVYPWGFATQDSGVAGNVDIGKHSWKSTIKSINGQGEQERSTTATGEQLTLAAAHFVLITIFNLFVTLKTTRPPSLEIWRTTKDPNDDSPYYLVTGQDPNTIIGDNCWIPNQPTVDAISFSDNLSDADLLKQEANPENGAVLEFLAPPGAKIIIATADRLFIAGVCGEPDRVWSSRLRAANEVASFHDDLAFDVPRPGGAITAIWFDDNGVLYVSRETAIYAFLGPGLDNLGQGQNFQLTRIISEDVGALGQETVALTPRGVTFKSRKGWYLIGANGTEYIGDKVTDFDDEDVLAVNVVETQHQVRILTAARMLVWDYLVNQWFEWSVNDGVHACMFGGQHVYLTATGTRTQQTDYSSATYGLDVETAPIKLADLQGAARCRRMLALGELRSACSVRMRVKYNYQQGYVDDVVRDLASLSIGDPLELKLGPKRPQCEAIKLRITAVAATDPGFGDARAHLAPSSDGPAVTTSGTNWAPTFKAVAAGELGNVLTMSIGFDDGTPFSIDVRDDFRYDPATGFWSVSEGNIGVRVVCHTGSSPTVADLTNAIAAGSARAIVSLADATPTKIVNAAAMVGQLVTGTFHGGVFAAPSGEGIKLTSLGLEVGIDPGLYRRLPAPTGGA